MDAGPAGEGEARQDRPDDLVHGHDREDDRGEEARGVGEARVFLDQQHEADGDTRLGNQGEAQVAAHTVGRLGRAEREVRGEQLRLIVEPGQQARIISVRFLGNKVLSDEALGQAMFNRVDSAGARLQGLGRFVPEALSDDVTGLKQAYYAKGYISAQIQPPQVFVEPDLGGVRLEVRIQEGEPYTLTTLQVKGLPKGASFDYKAGQIFSVQGIHSTGSPLMS